jgi:iron complex outermembrane receptor protein
MGLALVGAAPTSYAPAAEATAPDPDAALSEIVVTATRTGETAVQRTPLAINAFTAQQYPEGRLLVDEELLRPGGRVVTNEPRTIGADLNFRYS